MQGIQQTLFDVFSEVEAFTSTEAQVEVCKRIDVKTHSVRARLSEGAAKGLFEKIAIGVYKVVTKNNATCLFIHGDGRDLSFLSASSIDAIITDHPYDLGKSHKGGNRDFANYDCFKYTQADLMEKARVLKPGGFLVEFLPEETGDNWEYLTTIKQLASRAGLKYYAKVPWRKLGFVANTGRKAKDTEELLFFTLGKPRSLRKDAKKNKKDPTVNHFMSGAAAMLPTSFEVIPVPQCKKVHQAQKPLELLSTVLQLTTLPGEWVLDQYFGSGAIIDAAFELGRNCIAVEKDRKCFDGCLTRF